MQLPRLLLQLLRQQGAGSEILQSILQTSTKARTEPRKSGCPQLAHVFGQLNLLNGLLRKTGRNVNSAAVVQLLRNIAHHRNSAVRWLRLLGHQEHLLLREVLHLINKHRLIKIWLGQDASSGVFETSADQVRQAQQQVHIFIRQLLVLQLPGDATRHLRIRKQGWMVRHSLCISIGDKVQQLHQGLATALGEQGIQRTTHLLFNSGGIGGTQGIVLIRLRFGFFIGLSVSRCWQQFKPCFAQPLLWRPAMQGTVAQYKQPINRFRQQAKVQVTLVRRLGRHGHVARIAHQQLTFVQ